MSSHTIDAGDASTIYQGSPVIAAAGYVDDIATAGAVPNMGAFWGCFYVDPTTLKPTFKNYYPGSITPPSLKILKLLFMTILIKCLKFNQTMTGASALADVFSNADWVSWEFRW